MGVNGLLPVLKAIQEPKSLKCYSGQRLAIDGYAWLHRAVYACTWELAHDQPTEKYLVFFKRRVNMLRNIFNIEPYFVFDGDHFSSKAQTEESRRENRRVNKELGLKSLAQGNNKKAYECFTKSVDVNPTIAKTVIEYLKAEGIEFVVAPYEADSQMVYLEQKGLVHGIISEDSDLLIFGCQNLLTKFNEKDGTVIEISAKNFKRVKDVQIGSMTANQLRMVACISGCDYTNGIPRIGIKKAFQVVKNFHSMDRILLKLKLDKYQVPNQFLDEYKRANLSFLYPRVFDTLKREMTTLNEIPKEVEERELQLIFECIGELRDIKVHCGIACGDLDPITKRALVSREELLLQQRPTPATKASLHTTPVKKPGGQRTMQRSHSSPVSATKKTFKTLDMFKFLSSSQKPTQSAKEVASAAPPTPILKNTTTAPVTKTSNVNIKRKAEAPEQSVVSKKLNAFKNNERPENDVHTTSKYFPSSARDTESKKVPISTGSSDKENDKDNRVTNCDKTKLHSASTYEKKSSFTSFTSFESEQESDLSELSDGMSDEENHVKDLLDPGNKEGTKKLESDKKEDTAITNLREKFMCNSSSDTRVPLADKDLNLFLNQAHDDKPCKTNGRKITGALTKNCKPSSNQAAPKRRISGAKLGDSGKFSAATPPVTDTKKGRRSITGAMQGKLFEAYAYKE